MSSMWRKRRVEFNSLVFGGRFVAGIHGVHAGVVEFDAVGEITVQRTL